MLPWSARTPSCSSARCSRPCAPDPGPASRQLPACATCAICPAAGAYPQSLAPEALLRAGQPGTALALSREAEWLSVND
jgi:hypothetical protein